MAMPRVRVLTSLVSRSLLLRQSGSGAPTQVCSRELWQNHHQDRQSGRFRVDAPAWKRRYSDVSDKDYTREVDDINSKFAEAREEIELALESKETVYFDEEAATAKLAVEAVLGKYEALLAKLSPENKGVVQRSMGLKMEQLKAELGQLKD